MMRIRTFTLAVCILALALTVSAAQDTNQAGLVVRYGDERVETYCVAFVEPEISGRALMDRAGLSLEVEEVGMGATICRIEEVGCPGNDCFCQCRGGACTYWSYWALRDGSWQYAASGASVSLVRDGDVHGWSWGPGSVTEAVAPPTIAFDEICGETPEMGTAAPVDSAPIPTDTGAAVTLPSPTPPTPASNVGSSVPGSYAYLGIIALVLGVLAWRAYARRKP